MNFNSITIIGGTNKDNKKENIESITINKGEIVTIIGFTGSGKTQLIKDIEQLAEGDTITKRKILVDGNVVERNKRYLPEFKLVAHLTQNMNYITDMRCDEFLFLRAKSRNIKEPEKNVDKIIKCANKLCGEHIEPNSILTSLSGGQSRALMIADTAINAKSPIILIDEIENAGIDKTKAISELLGSDRIVLVVTHDPILALMGKKRIIMRNGGMEKLLELTSNEEEILKDLQKLNEFNLDIQRRLRDGDSLK